VAGYAATLLLCGAGVAATAEQYIPESPFGWDRGQDVSPTFDGWTRNADGTYSFYFGYLNRNRAEPLHIPIGPDNTIEGADRGQPTYFYPGGAGTRPRRWWVFKVVVPGDWPKDRRLVWTLASRGRTNKAAAWLQPEYEVDSVLMGMNAGDRLLFNTRQVADKENRPPVVSAVSRVEVTLPQTVTLTATADDDGRPLANGKSEGLRFRWIVYRGPTAVTFKPETHSPAFTTPAKAETVASFSEPGDYRIRVIASDGELASTSDLDVTVSPASSGQSGR
jgi:hypothetical protein